MKYGKSDAKRYAKQNMRGLWGGSLTPFTPDYKIDEDGFRFNIRYCIDHLQLDGMYVNALQGESLYQTIAERKRLFRLAVEESRGGMGILAYTSDPALENVIDMTRYAEDVGADYVGIVNPKFYLVPMTDEGVFQYFKYVADRVRIGIFVLNQMEHGYLMSPDLLNRIADLENVVGVKNIAPAPDIMRTRTLCGEKIIVSESSEANWLINLTVRGQVAMVADPDPYCLQSKKLMLVKEYTDLAARGEIAKALEAYKRLEPIRRALNKVMVRTKSHATYKYWTQCLGMAGGDGRVRLPHVELTAGEKQAIEAAVATTGLV
jgi:4-hydroxy-tetrahydrodipicolinate synthase